MIKIRRFGEAKQVSDLYHITDIEGFIHIVEENILEARNFTYISCTRDRLMTFYFGMKPSSFFKIQLDGEKLSNHFKIAPFNYKGAQSNISFQEFEEIILTDRIPSIDKFILKYIFIYENYEKFYKEDLSVEGYNLGSQGIIYKEDLKTYILSVPEDLFYIQNRGKIQQIDFDKFFDLYF
ncbi:MAG: hypothetical protein ACOCV8_05650 [Spirochaetota bacterium]